MSDDVYELIRRYEIREAFWTLYENSGNDATGLELFLQLLSFNNNVALLQPDSGKIREIVENGCSPYMAYAYARLHDVLQPDPDSDRIKKRFYTVAADNGIADAYAYLAYMYRDGDLGEQDIPAYEDLMRKAESMQSEKAFQQSLRDLINGVEGTVSNPSEAYELACGRIAGRDFPNPVYYLIMGDVDMQLGRKDDAVRNYRNAAENGCSQAFYWWAMAECCDKDFKILDRARFMEIMQKGIEVCAADSFLMYPMLLEETDYDVLDDGKKAEIHKKLSDDLNTGWLLGDGFSAYFLGDYFENGRYGFTGNNAQAWLWYSRGAVLRIPFCHEALVRMFFDYNTAPSSCEEKDAYEFAYRGLLLGSEELLEVVVRGYKNGFLTNHSSLIESKWLPVYEAQIGRMMDDYEDFNDCYPEYEIEED